METSTSTVDTTKTTTTSATRTGQPARRGPRALAGPSSLEIAAAEWATMSTDERNSYAVATNDMIDAAEPTLPTRKTAYGTFVSLTAANLASGQSVQTTAVPYAPVPRLPSITVTASYVNKHFTLTLTPASPYPHPVAVRACKPLLAAANPTTATKFKKIGYITDLSTTVDATALFNSRFRVLGTNLKIVLELTAVAPGGYHAAPVYVFGIVTNVAAAAAVTEPEDAQPKASKLELG